MDIYHRWLVWNPGGHIAAGVMMKSWVNALDRNDVMYFFGLAMVFVGLSLSVSVATALIIVGAVMSGVSVVASFFVTGLSARSPSK